jgi:hypothetical protein
MSARCSVTLIRWRERLRTLTVPRSTRPATPWSSTAPEDPTGGQREHGRLRTGRRRQRRRRRKCGERQRGQQGLGPSVKTRYLYRAFRHVDYVAGTEVVNVRVLL